MSLIRLLLALCAAALVSACGGGSSADAGTPSLGGGSSGTGSGGTGGGTTTTALFTTAPSELTLGAAQTTDAFEIKGGNAPYTATTSNPGVATVVLNGSSFKVAAVSDGIASVSVKDASGAAVPLAVTVLAPLLTTAPLGVTLAPGTSSESFAISGGKVPYTAVTANAAVTTVALTGSTFKVTAVSNGETSVTVKDAGGGSLSLSVTVTSPLLITSPAALTLRSAEITPAFAISGGKAPYTVVSSNMSVATSTLATTNTFKITGVANGAATVYVTDAAGIEALVRVTVLAPLFSTAPSLLMLPTAATSEPYAISGGRAPYVVTSASPTTVTAALSGNSFTVSALKDGTADIQITDSDGARIALTVVASTNSGPLFSTAPSAITLRSASTSDAYTVSGGRAPYTVLSSNGSVATVSQSGASFNVNGVSDGAAVVSIKDAAGTQVTVSVTVLTDATALFTTAPGALSLRPATTSDTYKITGGKAPYTVVTSSAAVVTVAQPTNQTFRVTGVANGSAAVLVKDSAGTEVQVSVTVSSTAATLFTTAPAVLTLPASVTSDLYTIAGGTAPYTVVTSNPATATVSQTGSTFTIRSVADGVVTVTVKDATGSQVTVSVTVSSQVAALFTTAPTSLTLKASVVSDAYSISGGKAPYTVVTSDPSVAAVALASATSFRITGVGDGTAAVYVKDAAGVLVLVNLTVATSSGPLFSTAPSALSLPMPGTSEAYTISGGISPYTVTTSSPAVAAVSRSGNNFSVNSVGAGIATLAIKDAVGAQVQVAVTVFSSAGALFTTASAVLTVPVGSASEEYTISGGRAPYSISSSNVAVASVGMNGSRFVITGIAGGKTSVVLKDSVGAALTLDVTVGSATALFTTATPQVNIAAGVTRSYVVVGGSAPYTTSTSDSSVATAVLTRNTLEVAALKPGAVNVVVRDTLNAQVTISVTVPSGSTPVATPLFTNSPRSITVAPGTTPAFKIGGGSAPYTVQSSDTAVATAAVAGDALQIAGLKVGSATIVVTDQVGAQVSISVTVGAAQVVALYTSAPANGLTLAIGEARTVEIGGGVGPYQVTAKDASKVSVSLAVNGSTVSAAGVASGFSEVAIFDSTGRYTYFFVTVPDAPALFTTAPSGLSMASDSARAFVVGGGTGPYTATSDDSRVVVASVVSGAANLSIQAMALGTARVVLRDGAGASLSVFVSVTSAALSTSAPAGLKLVVAAPASQYTVSGGVAPYTATSSDTSVMTVSAVSLAGGVYSYGLTGVLPGSASLVLRDAAGAIDSVLVTVSTTPNLALTAPGSVTMQPAAVASYPITGGLAPYFAVSGNVAVATAVASGGSLTVTAVTAGSAPIVVRDSVGASVTLNVTVGPGPALYTSAPSPVTIARGEVADYAVGGGAGSFVVSSNNVAAATATLIGSNTLRVNGVRLGSAVVQVRDAAGAVVSISVTVGPGLALFTSAPSAITVLPRSAAYDYAVAGGTAPYRAVSSNEAFATVTTNGTSQMSITGLAAGSAVVRVSDALGAVVSVAVTVTPIAATPLKVTPLAVTASVGDSLNFVVAGGDPSSTPAPPYKVTVQNSNLMTATDASTTGGLTTFNATLTNIGATSLIITDSKGQTVEVPMTITNNQPLIRLSPSMIEIGENFAGDVIFYVSGGKGLLTAYTNSLVLSSVPGASFAPAVGTNSVPVTVGLGTQGNRCVTPPALDASLPADTVDVKITVVDNVTGRSSTSILRIKDNRTAACP